ncbi:hypothetical protein AB0K74_38690, partial [Streptomyces sp. NPDC056159]
PARPPAPRHPRAPPPPPRRGRVGGRPTVATEEVIRAARDLLPDPGRSITSIAKLLGVSPGTLYNHIPDLQELRTGAVPCSPWSRTSNWSLTRRADATPDGDIDRSGS